ncbi:MAG: nucleoside hydrolase [Actinomycetaceae bacterium]|nr:nucleoside hydrolase [Actinomycetaceae bacterium]
MTTRIPLGSFPWRDDTRLPTRRRVIIDNDFAGDPDDLYQLAHHLLSPSVEIRGIICSHLGSHMPFHGDDGSPRGAEKVARTLFDAMGIDPGDKLWLGSPTPIGEDGQPQPSPAVDGIIAEALRDDTDDPLYLAVGGGLTDTASAWLTCPEIASRLTVVWIGGSEIPGGATPPPGAPDTEYNLAIDPRAAAVVINESSLPLWVVPRDRYRQCLVSFDELAARVRPCGPVGALLWQELRDVAEKIIEFGLPATETYALGDSPLVLLTALQSTFEMDASSSESRWEHLQIDDRGIFRHAHNARSIRIFTRLDTRLMFEDFFHKLAAFAHWQAGAGNE